MWIELSNLWIILLNVVGIPSAHLAFAILATRLPASLFSGMRNQPASRLEMQLHDQLFLTRKWKYLLPDAAPWLGGVAKGKLTDTSPEYLHSFIAETRRGELSHWAQALVIFSFIAWNPWPANLVIASYAMLSNFPCILNLRFTRARLTRVLDKKTQSYE